MDCLDMPPDSPCLLERPHAFDEVCSIYIVAGHREEVKAEPSVALHVLTEQLRQHYEPGDFVVSRG